MESSASSTSFTAEQELAYLLPLAGLPRAVFRTTLTYEGGVLVVEGVPVLRAATRGELEHGVDAALFPGGERVTVRLAVRRRTADLDVLVNGRPARRADALRVPPSRSAWTHACLALAGSAAGFVASYLYLHKASVVGDEWAFKMGTHMAGWHLLLTLTLFPASVWGQRRGIRVVQLVSLVFFLIHAGIALANVGPSADGSAIDAWIGVLNAASGLLFLATTLYGNRAHRDMDPVRALRRAERAGAAARPAGAQPHG